MPSAIFTFRCYMFLFLFKTSPFPTRNVITTAIQPCQSFKLHLACSEKGGYTLLFIGLYRGLPIWRDIWASHGFPSVAVNITHQTNNVSSCSAREEAGRRTSMMCFHACRQSTF